uniref:Transducin/WD40 repeat-like superfamily protein n=1 Tax=Ascaris lumbricoides TaxID=6252 RepID=A0A0M3HQ18_ASCLU
MAEASPNQASLFIDKHLSRSLLDVSNSSGQVLAANPKPRVFEGHLDSKAVFVAALGKRIDISPCTQGGHFLVEIPKNLVVVAACSYMNSTIKAPATKYWYLIPPTNRAKHSNGPTAQKPLVTGNHFPHENYIFAECRKSLMRCLFLYRNGTIG